MSFSTPADAQHKNALLEPLTLPYASIPFDKLTAADYEEAVKEGIKQQNQEIDAIVKQRSTPTFENTIVPLERSGKLLTTAEYALGNLEHVLGDTLMMKALMNVTPLLSEHASNILLNEALWNRIKQVYERRNEATDLTPEDMRLLELTYQRFAQNGANLSHEDRDKLRKLNAELSNLTVKFGQNVTNGMKEPDKRMWLTKEQLGGLPQSAIDAARLDAKETLEAEGKTDDGSLYLFTVYYPSYAPFMKYSTERDLRKKLNTLYNSRSYGGKYDNSQVLKDIANIRLEIARLMGKKNFAEFQLQQTMAGNPENVYSMLENLKANYAEPMRREIEEIQNYARKTEGEDFILEPWDYTFWAEKLKADQYAFDEEDMKPYFELNNTIKGVFNLATKLYGYTFKEAKGIPSYHPDARVWEVYGPDKKILGLFFTDFFYRPGKAAGAWMTEYRTEYKDEDGKRIIPIVSLCCNFSKPVGDQPVLLSPLEVETFLHEFGHSLHGLSAEAKYASISGTNVYHDFVELFSQFNENYLTQKEFLDSFAKHYKTGKKMPQSLIDKFIRASQFGAAYACMRQLGFGYLDMAYHTISEPLRASSDFIEFEKKAIEPVKIFDTVEGTAISPAFSHVFSGGYAAGYYGYKWSEELDADAFAEFQEHGIFDKKTADKFRKMLQAGGTKDPMELYIEFRGKKPTIDALLKRDGIKK
ncbi:MAG: M3 family metallopeptidase [Muribaculaceae bacterium]|nr:M3 family metallopeptidase [Muribaculaceae bacterium]